MKTKPKTVICTTFELLIASGLYKLFHPSKTDIYYDIIENYSLNLWHQENRSFFIKLLFYPHIKFREALSSLFVSHYFYSDKIYLTQLNFIHKKPHTHLPNYYSSKEIKTVEKVNRDTQFLITGTISKDYGIEKGISWFLKILEQQPGAKLVVFGHQTGSFNQIENNQIEYRISTSHVPHQEILTAISECDVLLMPYIWSKCFEGCIPSKLYEAIHLGTRVLITYTPYLIEFEKLETITLLKDEMELGNPLPMPGYNKKNKEFLFINLYPELDLVFLKKT